MPIQDLTPQLRTRLNRMERVVGLFLFAAIVLLCTGLGYYLYHSARRQGWFLQKVPYYVYVVDASGLRVGDPVRLMGFDIGRITAILPMPPTDWFVANQYNVFVQFEVLEPHYGYIWTDSKVRIDPGDILGGRQLEVLKGQTGQVTVREYDGRVREILSEHVQDTYVPLTEEAKGVWLEAEESPVVTERISRLVTAVETALPALTNELHLVLSSSTGLLDQVSHLTLQGQTVATNLVDITDRLRQPGDSLGRWLFPSNFNAQLDSTLVTAENTFAGFDSNVVVLVEKLGVSLDQLAGITSNLHAQVQANTNILSDISRAVVHTDELVQGLKRHWFLRGAFKGKTNRPAAKP